MSLKDSGDGMKPVLLAFKSDVEHLLEEHKRKVKSLDNPRYCLNYGDLSITDVFYRVSIDGDVTLGAIIEEGLDPQFDAWIAAQLQARWGDAYYIEVRTEW